MHPWRVERIEEENILVNKYGLKNKSEVWRAKSMIGKFRQQARHLLGSVGEESEKETTQMLDKLSKLGIIKTKKLEDVLALTVEDLLNRRLQTLVFKKGLTTSVKQARQFIIHRHVIVGRNVVDVPGYIMPAGQEDSISLKKVVVVGKKGEGGKTEGLKKVAVAGEKEESGKTEKD